MNTNVLSYLARSAENYPDKPALVDETSSYTYRQTLDYCQRLGTGLSRLVQPKQGVGVYMEKTAQTLCVFFGAVYAGCFYSALNTELPASRLAQIASVLEPGVIVTTCALEASAREIFGDARIVTVEELEKTQADPAHLEKIQKQMVDTDPLYINFTSGSTGVPKGIVVCHRSVLDFIGCFPGCLI